MKTKNRCLAERGGIGLRPPVELESQLVVEMR
jgi:hypothetical protein